MNTSAFGVEKGSLIKVPATANLMIDSADRTATLNQSAVDISTAWNFTIARRQALISGYFTRIGTTEVVLEWCEDNINSSLGNTVTLKDLSGVATTITIPPGKYTVADALDAIVAGFQSSALGSGRTFSVSTTKIPGQVVIDISGLAVIVTGTSTPLSQRLDIGSLTPTTNTLLIICPDLRPYRYLDFTCDSLTTVQDVKDASTADFPRDVLCRWYFSYDDPPQLDAYGFPILMGYTRFCLRRIYNPPKQIKWEQNLQVGNLVFTVYDDQGVLLPSSDAKTNWLMTLQLTEG